MPDTLVVLGHVDTEFMSFIVHVEILRDGYVHATVYEGIWCHHPDGEKEIKYTSKTVGGLTYEELIDDCREMFVVTAWIGGDYDERLYFKDDEYWGEEFESMYKCYQEVSKTLREFIEKHKQT